MPPVDAGDRPVARAAPLTLDEVAARLGVHYMTAYRYVRLGRLRGRRRAGRWYVDLGDLAAFRDGERPARGRRGPIDWPARRRRLFDALVSGDEPSAWVELELSFAAVAPAEVYAELLGPTLGRVGEAWAAGEITTADEHRASAVAIRLVGRSGPFFRRRGRTRGTVLLACAPLERHALPVAMLADIVRGDGWEAVDLGADVPAEDLARTAAELDRLAAVGVSVTMPGNERAVRVTVDAVHDAVPGVPVLLGGHAVQDSDTAYRLGADAWAPDAAQVRAYLAGLSPTRVAT